MILFNFFLSLWGFWNWNSCSFTALKAKGFTILSVPPFPGTGLEPENVNVINIEDSLILHSIRLVQHISILALFLFCNLFSFLSFCFRSILKEKQNATFSATWNFNSIYVALKSIPYQGINLFHCNYSSTTKEFCVSAQLKHLNRQLLFGNWCIFNSFIKTFEVLN